MPMREINKRQVPYPETEHPIMLTICDVEFSCGNCGKTDVVLRDEDPDSRHPKGWRWLSFGEPFCHEYACSIACARKVADELIGFTFEA